MPPKVKVIRRGPLTGVVISDGPTGRVLLRRWFPSRKEAAKFLRHLAHEIAAAKVGDVPRDDPKGMA